MQTVTMPATYSNGVIIPSRELNIEKSIDIMITINYENEIPVIRDEDGFTEEGRRGLEKLLDETDKGIGVSKPYSNIHTLINDLRNNDIKY